MSIEHDSSPRLHSSGVQCESYGAEDFFRPPVFLCRCRSDLQVATPRPHGERDSNCQIMSFSSIFQTGF